MQHEARIPLLTARRCSSVRQVLSALALAGLVCCQRETQATPQAVQVQQHPQQTPPVAAAAPAAAAGVVEPPFGFTSTIQDVMASMIDPSADALWESVGTIVDANGEDDRQPRTDEEWKEVRHRAVTLIEGTNLIAMKGRRIAAPGKKLEDEGVLGIYTAAEAQAAIDADHDKFVAFARALHDVGIKTLNAIDARDVPSMLDAGEAMDEVCEGCHMTFWYPNQVIP